MTGVQTCALPIFLSQNEEFTLVEEGTSYGLTVYDRIVLNGDAVDEDEFIYQ